MTAETTDPAGRLTAEDGAEADGLAPAFAAISASRRRKPPSAPVTWRIAIFSFFAIGGSGLSQQLAQGCAAALVAEEHEVILVEAAADSPEVGQRKGHIRQDAPAALAGGFEGDAVVAPVFLLFLLGRPHAAAAENGMKVTSSSTPWRMTCSSLSLLGITHQQGDVHGGLCGAGVARLHAELHRLVAETG